ncbi:MAG: asparagine synthetase B [Gammaproteobacteria bacterium]|nr:asparagine synthetase B [Gammaproteobacteria bacterium]
MNSQLGLYGPDGYESVQRDGFLLRYHRMWTVPEEVGEAQPLHDAETDTWLAFYGRVDNRADLFADLNLTENVSVSDAALLQRYLKEFGDARLARIVGPFALVFYDARNKKLLAARDAMGGRQLFYHQSGSKLYMATHEMALAAHPDIGYQLNDEKRLRILCHLSENRPSSTLQNITPLFPGQQLEFHDGVLQAKTFYLPDSSKRLRGYSESELAAEYRRLLKRAVARRMRSIEPVGCMLSGGLDSIPMTIAAVQTSARPVTAYSWVFDEFADDDERLYSTELCEQLQIPQEFINCDRQWPQFDESTYTNPALCYATPFSAFNQALLARASQCGSRVLLSGVGGDLLYSDGNAVLLSLLRQGRLREALAELKFLWPQGNGVLRLIKNHLMVPLPKIRNRVILRRLRKNPAPAALSERARQVLQSPPHWLTAALTKAHRPQQFLNVMDSLMGDDIHAGKHMEAGYGVERRFPFRDRDLVEFALALPAEQLRNASVSRPIVMNAFRADLSERLKARNAKTKFHSVMDAGLEREQAYQHWFERSEPLWRKDVKNCYFSDTTVSEREKTALKWYCGYHGFWQAVCYNPLRIKLGLNDDRTNEK